MIKRVVKIYIISYKHLSNQGNEQSSTHYPAKQLTTMQRCQLLVRSTETPFDNAFGNGTILLNPKSPKYKLALQLLYTRVALLTEMSVMCTLTVDQLKKGYPELNFHDSCPVCEKKGLNIMIGDHHNPVSAPLPQAQGRVCTI